MPHLVCGSCGLRVKRSVMDVSTVCPRCSAEARIEPAWARPRTAAPLRPGEPTARPAPGSRRHSAP